MIFPRDKNGTKNMIIMSNTKKRGIDNKPFASERTPKQFQSPRHDTSQLFDYQMVARYLVFRPGQKRDGFFSIFALFFKTER